MAERLGTQLRAAIEDLVEARFNLVGVNLGSCNLHKAQELVDCHESARGELDRILLALTNNRGPV